MGGKGSENKQRKRKRKEVVAVMRGGSSVPEMGARLSVFCPVARTSKRNPVRGTKPRIAVDKLSFDESGVYAFARASLDSHRFPRVLT